MVAGLTAFEVPLRVDSDGVIRVGKTRVTLDTVIGAFKRGESPESIAAQFPAVTLVEVYGAVAYYLQHQAEIDAYLQEGEAQAASLRRELEDQFNPVGLREKLVARLDEKRQHGNHE